MASFGENLRRERELRGVSLREISDSTKISMRFLQALEQDRLEILPGGLFPRAFVRQYARHLGLDAERLVADFVFSHKDSMSEETPRPRRPDAPPRSTLVVVVLALAGGVLLLWRGGAPASKEAVSAVVLPVSTLPADPVYPPPAQANPQTIAEGESLVLTLNARQSCWVAAQVDGQTVLNRVLQAGETETLQAGGEIVLSVGNAGGLAFRVNDRPGVPLGRNGEVRRNIVITRKSLPSFVEDAPSLRASQRS